METCELAAYEETVNILRSIAHKMRRLFGQNDYDELFAEANYLFVVAYRTFDPEKEVPFSRYLYNTVRNGLLTVLRGATRRGKLLPRAELRLESIEAVAKEFDMDSFLESLSHDGLLAVVGAFEYEDKKRLTESLKNTGWTRERIKSAFDEIRTLLEN